MLKSRTSEDDLEGMQDQIEGMQDQIQQSVSFN